MDFSQGNFRVSYLDFRANLMFNDSASLGINVEADYHRHAMVAIRELVATKGDGPHMFYLELRNENTPLSPENFMNSLLIIRSWFGLGWKGKFIVHLAKHSLLLKNAFSRSVSEEKPRLVALLEELDVAQVDYIDEEHMAFPMLHTMESALDSGYIGVHWHRQCNENGMHSCSHVSDMAAHQLLNVARLRAASSAKTNRGEHDYWGSNRTLDTPFQFCMSCPSNLVPFTIRPNFLNAAVCLPFIPKDTP